VTCSWRAQKLWDHAVYAAVLASCGFLLAPSAIAESEVSDVAAPVVSATYCPSLPDQSTWQDVLEVCGRAPCKGLTGKELDRCFKTDTECWRSVNKNNEEFNRLSMLSRRCHWSEKARTAVIERLDQTMKDEGQRLTRFLNAPCPPKSSPRPMQSSDRKCGTNDDCSGTVNVTACVMHLNHCRGAVERINTAVTAFNNAVSICNRRAGQAPIPQAPASGGQPKQSSGTGFELP
jgi:hypothetical protein